MRLLVIQEQHFIRMPNGEVWVDEQSNSKFWERYLNVFDEVVVCARFKHYENYKTDKLMLSDCPNVTFVELPNWRGVAGLLKNIFKVIKKMTKAMKACDRIIFRAPSPISMVAYPLARLSGKPYAAEIMNNPYTHFSPDSMRHIYQPILRWLIVKQTKSLCKHANGVSYVTESVLQNLYPSRARLKGASNKFFESSYSTIRMEKSQYSYDLWSGQKPNPTILIHTGKMQDNRKGQDIFIETIGILVSRGYDVVGILVGEGELRKDFEELGKKLGVYERLDFVGWKAGFESVQAELKRAHFAVFPSKGEGLPRSVIEAMSQGLLCFGTAVDGICELLEGDCLITINNASSFADKIQLFLDNWTRVESYRVQQFNKSKEYECLILNERRTEFYKKLRDVTP